MTGSSGLSGISTLNNINHLTDSERLATTGVSVDEDALSWFQWTEVRESFISLDDFKCLLLRFRPFQEGSLYEQFLEIKQEGMVSEYRRRFELLSTPLHGLPMEAMESTFVKGL